MVALILTNRWGMFNFSRNGCFHGKISPIQFFRQVKQEIKKVTWPTRKEVVRTSIMVVVLVAIASAFFFFVDQFSVGLLS